MVDTEFRPASFEEREDVDEGVTELRITPGTSMNGLNRVLTLRKGRLVVSRVAIEILSGASTGDSFEGLAIGKSEFPDWVSEAVGLGGTLQAEGARGDSAFAGFGDTFTGESGWR